ncbi:MAG: hypothetical protein FGM61_11385 [Sediminibacterium sp.]|nr:hypothetical protein [Sediminibacterium sp.]
MQCRLLIFFILFSTFTNAQYKSFVRGPRGDSLNKIDMNDLKQGRWVIKVPAQRGNPGYEEEGFFKDDQKHGVWKTYNLMGDKIAEEVYRFGNKDGRCTYYNMAGMIREEYWRAPRKTDQLYDTINVPDPGVPNTYKRVIIRNEGHSIKHGTWRYYDPVYGRLIAEEKYFLDDLQVDNTAKNTPPPVDTSAKKRMVLPKLESGPKVGSNSRTKSVIQ